MDVSATAILASIRRRASIPTTSVAGSADADLLRYANEELQLNLMADILAVREEYFVRDLDQTIVAGTSSYRIPTRAIGGKLRQVQAIDAAGVGTTLPRIEPERAYGDNTSSLFGYVLKGNYVVLVPSASTTYSTLRLSYFIRPNDLVASGTQAVTTITPTTLTVASTTGFTTSTPCDLVASTPGYEHLALDITPTGVTGTVATFAAADLPAGLSGPGVILCLAGQSSVAQIPVEYVSILCQRAAIRYLEASGMQAELAAAKKTLEEMERKVLVLITPRDDAGTRKIIATGATGSIPGTTYRGQ